MGRPRTDLTVDMVRACSDDGLTLNQTMKRLGASASVVKRLAAEGDVSFMSHADKLASDMFGLRNQLVELARFGCTIDEAARRAGIERKTLANTRRREGWFDLRFVDEREVWSLLCGWSAAGRRFTLEDLPWGTPQSISRGAVNDAVSAGMARRDGERLSMYIRRDDDYRVPAYVGVPVAS